MCLCRCDGMQWRVAVSNTVLIISRLAESYQVWFIMLPSASCRCLCIFESVSHFASRCLDGVYPTLYYCFGIYATLRMSLDFSQSVNQSRNNRFVWLSGLVVSALGIWAWWPRFESRVAPLFHWVATLGKFTHIASAVSQLQETGVQKGVFDAYVVMVIKCARLS